LVARESGFALLSVNKEMHQVYPSSTPGLASPLCDNLDKLESTLVRISAYLKDGAKEWWRNWIEDIGKQNKKQPFSTEYEGTNYNCAYAILIVLFFFHFSRIIVGSFCICHKCRSINVISTYPSFICFRYVLYRT